MNQHIEPSFGHRNAPPPLPPLPAASAPPPKRGMHGCLIALIVCAALAVPLIGILAAIAVPAYQDYTIRATVAAAVARGQGLQIQVESDYLAEGRCRASQEPARPGETFAVSVATGADADGRCTIELTLHGPRRIDGRHLRWTRIGTKDGADWSCRSDLDARDLPAACRTP